MLTKEQCREIVREVWPGGCSLSEGHDAVSDATRAAMVEEAGRG